MGSNDYDDPITIVHTACAKHCKHLGSFSGSHNSDDRAGKVLAMLRDGNFYSDHNGAQKILIRPNVISLLRNPDPGHLIVSYDHSFHRHNVNNYSFWVDFIQWRNATVNSPGRGDFVVPYGNSGHQHNVEMGYRRKYQKRPLSDAKRL